MATDHPAFALPAPLGSTLQALRDAKAARNASRAALDEATTCYLLAASTWLALKDRDAEPARLLAAEVEAEREAHKVHLAGRAAEQATQVYLAVADRSVDDAEPFLPANDAADDKAAE